MFWCFYERKHKSKIKADNLLNVTSYVIFYKLIYSKMSSVKYYSDLLGLKG